MEVPSGVKLVIGEKSKSYSPVSLPKENAYLDLLVKPYPKVEGGGFGASLCDLEIGETALMKLKPARKIHGSEKVIGRFNWIGLIGGGTGLAPLIQIAKAELDSGGHSAVRLLAVNRGEGDMLMWHELEEMATHSGGRLRVTFWDTSKEGGRGDVALAKSAIFDDAEDANQGERMVFVCGTDGFVAHWAGPIIRDENKKKQQGPLLGVLSQLGLTAAEVYKF